MRRLRQFLTLILILFACPVVAQEDDNGFLANLIQDNLSGPGRDVRLSGVNGLLSSNATIDQITVADGEGVWLRIENAEVRWTRTALLRGALEVETLSAETIEISRKPVPDASLPPAEATEFALPELPVTVNIQTLSAKEIIIAEDIFGLASVLRLDSAIVFNDAGLDIKFAGERLDGPGGQLSVAANLDRELGTISVDADIFEPSDGVIANLLGVVGRPALRAQITGQGPLSDVGFRLAISADDRQIVNGIVNLKADDSGTIFTGDLTAQLQDFVAAEYQDFFTGDSTVVLTGRRNADGVLDISDLRMKTAAFSLSGTLLTEQGGFPERLEITAAIRSDDGSSVSMPFGANGTQMQDADLDVSFGVTDANSWTASLRADQVVTDALRAETIEATYTGRVIDTETDLRNAIAGTLSASASGLEFGNIALDEAVGDAIKLTTRLDWQTGMPLVLHWVRILSGDMSLEARGRLDGLTFDGAIDIDAADIRRFSSMAGRQVSGAIAGTAAGQFSLLDMIADITFDIRAQDLQVEIERLDPYLRGSAALSGRLVRDETGTSVSGLNISSPTAKISADLGLTNADLQLNLTADVTELSYALPPLSGPARVSATAQGPLTDFTLDTTVETESGTSIAALGRAGSTLDITARVNNVPLSIANSFVTAANLAGDASGTAHIGGTPSAPIVDYTLNIDGFRSSYSTPYIDSALSISSTGVWGLATGFDIASLQVNGGGLSANASGTVAADFGNLSVDITGNAPLRLAAPYLVGAGVVASGDANIDLSITGQTTSPTLNGRVTIRGAEASVPGQNVRLSDVEIDIGLSGRRVSIAQASANVSGGGTVSITGDVALDNGIPLDLDIVLRDTVYSNGRNLTTVLDGDLRLTGSVAAGPVVTGTVDLGLTEIQLAASSTQLSNFVAVRHVAPSTHVVRTLSRAGLTSSGEEKTTAGRSLRLDIAVSAPSQVFVRGRGVDAEFGGQVRILGSTDAIEAVGGVDLIRGRMRFLDRRIDFTSGRVTMAGSLDPKINFVAQTQVTDASVTVTLSGTASAPDLSFSSSPPLADDEILARLIFSRSMEDLSIFQIAQLASAVAELTGSGGGGGLVERLRQSAGLSDLDIRSNEDGSTSVAAGTSLGDGFYSEVEIGSDGEAKLNINLDVLENVTARGSVSNDGETSVGIFYERDY